MSKAIETIVDSGMNAIGFPAIHDDSDFPIDGRELHQALGVGAAYRDWFPRMCEYGFESGKDFRSKMSESTGGRPATNHCLRIAMAKEICMLQRTPQGKKIRQYLISIEEAWNTPEQVMARALKMADQVQKNLRDQIVNLEADNQRLTEANEELAPLASYANNVLSCQNAIPITEIAKEYGWTGRQMNSFLHDQGVQYWNGNMWLLYAKYDDEGYTKTETCYYNTWDGQQAKTSTKWTQKGKFFIHGLMAKNGHYPVGVGDTAIKPRNEQTLLYDAVRG